jgi:hypothetical protein
MGHRTFPHDTPDGYPGQMAVFIHVKCYRSGTVHSNENVTKVIQFPQMIMLLEGMMSTQDTMNIDERRKYLRMMKKRYEQATRKGRGQLLDETD